MKTTAIVFEDTSIGRENIIRDLDVRLSNENPDDRDLQRVWARHGHHALSWGWKRIHTDSSAPSWGWVILDTANQANQTHNDIAILHYLDCFASELRALAQSGKVWTTVDDNGTHLGIQEDEGLNN